MGHLEPYLKIMNTWGESEVRLLDAPRGGRGASVDAEIRYHTPAGNTTYLAQLRPHFSNEDPHWITHRLSERTPRGRRALLFAPATTEAQRHVLCTDDVDFVDFAGNVHLERKGFLIHVEGKRSAPSAASPPENVFRRAGLQVIFALLSEPEAVTWPYRPLAKAGGVALRTANYVIDGLRTEGFVAGRGKRRRLMRRADLVARWVTAYSVELRPKLIVGTYRTRPRSQVRLLDEIKKYFMRQGFPWALTGGEAAYHLTRYYRGGRIVIYAPDNLTGFEGDLSCIPDPKGDLQILRYFSPAIEERTVNLKHPLAHPLLVYAELLSEGSDRALEAAEVLRDQYLGDYTNDS